eukprot:scaffold4489_cov165-Amphora_coffeaeformis.AAC.3
MGGPLSRPSSSRKDKDHEERTDDVRAADVLSGRGRHVNIHTGNRLYRRLVDRNKERYRKLDTNGQKILLAESIVLAVRQQGGRFLKRNTTTGQWDQEIPHRQAVLKTTQALRDRAKARSTGTTSVSHRHDRNTQEDMGNCRNGYGDNLDAEVPPPPLLLHPSAFDPATSKIAGAVEDQKAETDETLCSIYPPPTITFDEIIARQESLGVAGSSIFSGQGISDVFFEIPDPNREFSTSYATSNLLDD